MQSIFKMAEEQVKLKLSDEEKSKLIDFYKNNKALWSSSTSFRDKEEKSKVREELGNLFDNKYTDAFLEKNFHALRTAFNRESKKYKEKEPKKKWKFFGQMAFLKEELEKEKKVTFELEERETLIDFYSSNPPLWNHHLPEYRDRDLRNSLLEKLSEQFQGKFTKDNLKQEWHNLQTIYKREKPREEGSKSSGSGSFEVYISSWELFNNMEFLDITGDVDESVTSLDVEEAIQPPKRLKRQAKQQTEKDDAKTELWKSLAASLKPQEQQTPKDEKSARANLFGKVVADSLMQYEVSEWSYLKKKVMDVFFDFDQQKLNNSRPNFQSTPSQPNQFQFVPGQTWTNMINNPQTSFDPFSPASSHSSCS